MKDNLRYRIGKILLFLHVEAAIAQGASWWNSPYGADDEIGAANLLTTQLVRNAVSLVKTGKTYHLGIVVDSNTPSFGTRSFHLTVLQASQFGKTASQGIGSNRGTFIDDILYGWLGTGSQLDGLGHAGIAGTFYNGFNITDFGQNDGLTKLGIQLVPPLVTRGVLLNMASYFGTNIVDASVPFNKEEIIGAAKAQKVTIQKGDVVIFHTGWLKLAEGNADERIRYLTLNPGLGISGAWYLAKKGVVAIGADTGPLEVQPPENPGQFAKVHTILIPRFGIYILEVMNTAQLAADGVSEFMFVLGVPRVRGASQMIVNPLAIS